MFKKLINVLIFLFIFSLYFVSFLMIYDSFREKKLASLEKEIIDAFDDEIKIEETKVEEIKDDNLSNESISYKNYTILGKIEIPSIGFNSVILKENTYKAMSVGVIKTYGTDLNEQGGFVISGHNFRGQSVFMYNIKNLQEGSKIYITDTNGRKIEYTVYSVERNVNPTDASYLTTFEGYHVTLVTCENGGKARIVVKARA